MNEQPGLVATTIGVTGEPAQSLDVWGSIVMADRILDHYDEKALRTALRIETDALARDMRAHIFETFLAEYRRRKAVPS